MASIKKVGAFTQTVGALNSRYEDSFLPKQGQAPGGAQHLPRVEKRERMGQKKTPIGRSTLKPKKGAV